MKNPTSEKGIRKNEKEEEEDFICLKLITFISEEDGRCVRMI
jgi:hypothetical protein